MNERIINMNYKDALKQARKLESIASSIKKQVSDVENYNSDLRKNWTGDNAKRYCAKIDESKEQLRKKADDLNKIADAIRKSAQAYQRAEMQKLVEESETK